MTTIVPFRPTPFAPFSFFVTLDGAQYTVSVLWSVFGQRWYVNVVASDGSIVVSEGLSASPSAVRIASLTWVNGFVTAVTSEPHGYRLGFTTELTINGCIPTVYNGDVLAYIVDEDTLFWPLSADPGSATQMGVTSFDIDLVEQYFETSSIVFRESTQQFEINP